MVEPTQQPEEVETLPEQEGPETVAEPTEDSSQVNALPLLKIERIFWMNGIGINMKKYKNEQFVIVFSGGNRSCGRTS